MNEEEAERFVGDIVNGMVIYDSGSGVITQEFIRKLSTIDNATDD